MTREQREQAALSKARSGGLTRNYLLILVGFKAKGIPEEDIKPRENVYTYHAWRALGRSVKKGEHGIKVNTVIHTEQNEDGTEDQSSHRLLRSTTVFHISQTKELNGEG